MRRLKMRHIFRFLVAAFAIYGALLLWEDLRQSREPIRTAKKEAEEAAAHPVYAFNLDDDNDGVSNATEMAVGSDPQNSNTDGDDYPDGEELMHGYDPVRFGKARLSDRKKQTETVRFLSWASSQKDKPEDALADPSLLTIYLNETFNPPVLPVVKPRKVQGTTRSDLETITAYLYGLSLVKLPKNIARYSAIAQAIQKTGTVEPLQPLVKEIEGVEETYAKMIVPGDAIVIHKEYLLILAQLKKTFNDLAKAREDPVLIAKNIVIGRVLAEKAAKLEEAKAALGRDARSL